MAAAAQAVSEQQIAMRQEELRRETFKALCGSSSALADVLRRWPSPRPEVESRTHPTARLEASMGLSSDPGDALPCSASLLPVVPGQGEVSSGIPVSQCFDPQPRDWNSSSMEAAGLRQTFASTEDLDWQESTGTMETIGLDGGSGHFNTPDYVLGRNDEPAAPTAAPATAPSAAPVEDSRTPRRSLQRQGPSEQFSPDVEKAGQAMQAMPMGHAATSGSAASMSKRPSSPGGGRTTSPNRRRAPSPRQAQRPASPQPDSPRRSEVPAANRDVRETRRVRAEPVQTLPAHEVQAELDLCREIISSSVQALTTNHLYELRSMQRPHPSVKAVLGTVVILLGASDVLPATVKKTLMGDVLKRLKGINLDGISIGQFRRAQKFFLDPNFNEAKLRSVCLNAVPFASWCRGIMRCLAKTRFYGRAEVQVVLAAAASLETDTGEAITAEEPRRPREEVRLDAKTQEASEEIAENGGLVIWPELGELSFRELREVRDLTVSRPEVGSITFHGLTDCTDLDIPSLVHLAVGEVLVYPVPGSKPKVGEGLNKEASVTLHQCWPPNGRGHLDDAKAQERYRWKIQQMTEDKKAKFIDYDCTTGVWKFQVEHF